jgi:hypothetical protein
MIVFNGSFRDDRVQRQFIDVSAAVRQDNLQGQFTRTITRTIHDDKPPNSLRATRNQPNQPVV